MSVRKKRAISSAGACGCEYKMRECGPMWIVCTMHANIAKKKPGEHTTMVDPIPRHKIHTPPQVDVLHISKKIRSSLHCKHHRRTMPIFMVRKIQGTIVQIGSLFSSSMPSLFANMGSEQLESTNNNTRQYNNSTKNKRASYCN